MEAGVSERPAPRSMEEIFAELRALAQSDGALHEISALIYRDWLVTIDMQEGRVVDDPEQRWSVSKLNNNELMLLLGLMVQSQSDRIVSVQVNDDTFSNRADELLREFHDRVLMDAEPAFERGSHKFIAHPDSIGLVAREAIYYGADSFYLHQFAHFSRLRYRDDGTWLLHNVGLSIRPMIDIAKFIVDRINRQMTVVGHMRMEGHSFVHSDFTDSLLISKADIRAKFGQKADAFFIKFTTPVIRANTRFDNPFAINDVAISPIIELGEYLYVANQYRIFESIYESPFYWMMLDRSYRDTCAEHRGTFLEKTATHIFRSVFGSDNVYENVTIRIGKDIAGEIDILVVYGEFVLVVQAKSKRVTMKARAGDTEALKTDFDGAIQAPYRQALECVGLIRSGARCVTSEGKTIAFHSLPRLFPVIILSDPFPASTFLSGTMLERGDDIAPVIWDIGVLDCVARLLTTPIEMLFYLKCRSEVFDNVHSDSEYNFLGYHIKAKLGLPNDADFMVLERDFATVIDDYMIAADIGIRADRPIGILERLQIPAVSEMLSELKNADPRLAGVVIDLYDFSSAALENISGHILALRKEIATTGKDIKAISVPTATGGITYAVTRKRDRKATHAAEAIGRKHKYDTKSDRWYVILDSIETESPIDALLPLVSPWKEDEQEAKSSEKTSTLFKSWRERMAAGN